ncbi:conserved hypothetical protein [Ricinus communis]|uniref:Uncharacterized protein n=1 Tax=Ricinus communis TaxID=3988 RepID=B9TEG4_RICCO|nr:conserved hypothetical protein [Ricinus communis]
MRTGFDTSIGMAGTTFAGTIVIGGKYCGVGGWTVTDDVVFPQILSKANVANGYAAKILNGFQRFTLNGTEFGSAGAATVAEDDLWLLSYVLATGALTLTQNGTVILSATDTTYQNNTGMFADIYLGATNHGGTGLKQIIYDGDVSIASLPVRRSIPAGILCQ